MTSFYLAARYSWRDALSTCAVDLALLGHKVTSRWLGTSHAQEQMVHITGGKWAEEDLEDIDNSDYMIIFNRHPFMPNRILGDSRGGCWCEYGYATLGKKLPTLIIGQNNESPIFTRLDWPNIQHFKDWKSCYDWISGWPDDRMPVSKGD